MYNICLLNSRVFENLSKQGPPTLLARVWTTDLFVVNELLSLYASCHGLKFDAVHGHIATTLLKT